MAMTGAMSAAIAGMKTHMQALSVVGNNIANVNTYGYKTQRITFKDSLYSTLSAGSGTVLETANDVDTATAGGLNPQQLGYGCGVGTIDLNMATGDLSPTGMATDCAIQGDGFFIVGPGLGTRDPITDVANVKSLDLTRVGNFEFRNGYLVDKMSGDMVYGFIPNQAGTTYDSGLQPIKLPMDGNDFIDYENLSIDANGKITCTDAATGTPKEVGYIALAKVDNPSGLLHKDGPYYRAGEAAGGISLFTPNSALKALTGTGQTLKLLQGSETGLMTSFLEGSGTDLATEFSNMIIYQRGYQANTRIISVTDSMLEELVNIKR